MYIYLHNRVYFIYTIVYINIIRPLPVRGTVSSGFDVRRIKQFAPCFERTTHKYTFLCSVIVWGGKSLGPGRGPKSAGLARPSRPRSANLSRASCAAAMEKLSPGTLRLAALRGYLEILERASYDCILWASCIAAAVKGGHVEVLK